jgi:CRISPR/Cas system CSM-associated protein Csm3 (group 7 of RAMP superfamily)
MARRFIKAELVTTAPLKISSGANAATDSDVLLDSAGQPFIPGTTVAGVLRHYLEETGQEQLAKDWFGYMESTIDEGASSSVIVYDAFTVGGGRFPAYRVVRDGVKLDEFKTAEGTAKYDYQVIDRGVRLEVRIEVDDNEIVVPQGSKLKPRSTDVDELIAALIAALRSGDLAFGGKTTRGFGRFELIDDEASITTLELDMNSENGLQRYIDFSWDDVDQPDQSKAGESLLYQSESAEFDIASFLLIRDYATQAPANPSDDCDAKLVDAEALKNSDGTPVIPGTSWAGLFRHHMYRILRRAGYAEWDAKSIIECVFGTVRDGNRGSRSNIVFTESIVEDGGQNVLRQLNRTRNAIDRFTGGAGDKKLYTSQASYGGKVTLTVKWRKQIKDMRNELLESLVKATLADLSEGYVAIGGMTAVGGGLLRPVAPKGDAL